jgi:hypothetical protein
MTEINIPSITIDTPLPFNLNLREEGQPLHGLYKREHFVKILRIHIWENHARWHGGVGEVINYTVRTVGLAPQTKREKRFHVSERAAMVKYVNEWLAKTVATGLAKMAEQKSEKEMRANNHRRWMAEQIEKAGGIEERRAEILREAYNLAAKEVMQYESNSKVFGAIMTALIHHTPITLDETTRANIIARHTSASDGWSVKRYIDERMQELDKYLAEIKAEVAA